MASHESILKKMMPGLGEKYQIEMDTLSKPKAEYMTDEYFELDLPLAPAIMVEDEILVEGSDISQIKLETAICRHLGLPQPEETKKGIFKDLLKRKKSK